MQRWLLIFLLVLLPLQFVWAAASPYCRHEQTATVQHVGHHEHAHGKSKSAAAYSESTVITSDVNPTSDSDCEYCHHSACKPVVLEVSTVAQIARSERQVSTDSVPTLPPSDDIERPNWSQLS